MSIFAFEDRTPALPADGSAYVAPGACVIGSVTLGREASVWFGAVLRGDNEPIAIGAGSNLQEGVVVHTDPGFPVEVGEEVTVGHRAILHGCTVGEGALVGMGAVILNGAVIGPGCLIGANALIPEGKEIPAGSMVIGQPGRVKRELTTEEIADLRRSAATYRDKAARYRAGLRAL